MHAICARNSGAFYPIFLSDKTRTGSQASEGKCAARCVYVAPLEAIVAERYRDWQARFGAKLGINVVQLTGETAADLKLLERGNIVLSTPEVCGAA